MESKKIRLLIDSDLGNVALVGVAVNKLCSLISHGKVEPYDMELCVVEAVNNCIEHAYENQGNQEIEVIFTLESDRLVVHVCDWGKIMDIALLDQQNTSLLDVNYDDLESLDEQGRGLAIMKQLMDQVLYESKEGKNCLTMIKHIQDDSE